MSRIKVWAQKSGIRKGMWRGQCSGCGHYWHFWDWGAALGYGLAHLWREGHK